MKMTLYAVVLSEIKKPTDMKFYTICSNKNDCFKYINKLLVMENSTHFKMWCDLRNINPNNFQSWKEYVKNSDVNLHKYVVKKMKYNPKDMASVLRVLNGCVPLGCGYENEYEYTSFLSSIPEDKLKEIMDKCEDMEKKEAMDGQE